VPKSISVTLAREHELKSHEPKKQKPGEAGLLTNIFFG
jgi:hypothetical protein